MIIDTLENAKCYASLLPGFDLALNFLCDPSTASLADGRYEIDGNRVYAMVQTYTTMPANEGLLQAHRRYADIQMLLSGHEWIGYAPLGNQPVEQPYCAEKDVLFVGGPNELIALYPGNFALLLPQDAHLPGRTISEGEEVRKVVIKILMPQS